MAVKKQILVDGWQTVDEKGLCHTEDNMPSRVDCEAVRWCNHHMEHRMDGQSHIWHPWVEAHYKSWCLNDEELFGRLLLW